MSTIPSFEFAGQSSSTARSGVAGTTAQSIGDTFVTIGGGGLDFLKVLSRRNPIAGAAVIVAIVIAAAWLFAQFMPGRRKR